MLNTPLSELRPRRVTHAALVAFFKKRGYPRTIGVFGNFDRGEIQEPSERFLQLWAEAVGVDIPTVVSALRRTQRMRSRGTGPFAARKGSTRRAS